MRNSFLRSSAKAGSSVGQRESKLAAQWRTLLPVPPKTSRGSVAGVDETAPPALVRGNVVGDFVASLSVLE